MVTGVSSPQADRQWSVPVEELDVDDPLLGCLVALTRLRHRPLSADALRAGLPLVDNRLTPSLFVRAAARAGLTARILKRRLERISSLVLPAVLMLHEAQACVLLDIDTSAGKARVLFPESGGGEEEVALEDLAARYTGYAIFVQPEHRFDERAPEVHNIASRHWFWGTIGRSWRIYRDVVIASLLINLFALASPLFIMNVYDRVVPNNASETLWVLATGVAVVFLFDFLMRTLRGYFIDLAGRKADIGISSAIYERVLGLKMEARPVSVGAFANNLREFETIRDFIASATVTTLVDLPFILLFIGVLALIAGSVAVIPAAAVPLILLYGLIIQGPLRRSVENSFRASAQKNATLIEGLAGAETVKHLGAESQLQRRWEQAVAHIARWSAHSRLLSASAVNVAQLVQQLASVVVVLYGVHLVTAGDMSLGGLIASVILTGRALAPMGQVANLATRYHQASTALKTLNGIMEMPVDRPEDQVFVSRPRLKGEIEFDNVSFTYPGQKTEALSHVSFRIRPGERVGIIGRVGSGKTTIEKLIEGLYAPTQGAVRIDGTDLRQIDPADLRRNIGYVPQDVTLFFGSVRDNIVLGAPYMDDAAVLRAAELAGVTEFVNPHPLGFEMPVGERGERLSGGQRQSIAVARALLQDPPILLLDEPSNAMDNSSEEMMKNRLAGIMRGKTVIIVTHRASLLALVERVIVLDSGNIVADGPKEQVLEALRQGKLRMVKRP